MLDVKLENNLRNKLQSLVIHQGKLRSDKKGANKSFNEQLKECDKKIACVAETLNSKDETWLVNEFNQYEIEGFKK